MNLASLFRSKPRVVNIGLDSFANELSARGVEVAHVDADFPLIDEGLVVVEQVLNGVFNRHDVDSSVIFKEHSKISNS